MISSRAVRRSRFQDSSTLAVTAVEHCLTVLPVPAERDCCGSWLLLRITHCGMETEPISVDVNVGVNVDVHIGECHNCA